ncbi:hydroxyethylthiazole kinase [Dyadobacter jejuensis]|uniref:Hydroxyethylthiazole kinase n=1 Tax=Dyadobacter jejuensis TaxID=1082580 RepID=A0A316A8M7_9BACT|nr:hydroxyethylthiazole kinase [Dyadobacter jejuensis]PWJ54276.1 hydroxyethylthiazole kinase [Dyadobacter jejuensis]
MIEMNLGTTLLSLRNQKPLVHNITNFVVMNYTANALLAVGASPVMAHAPEEVEEMVGLAGSLVINIGTLSSTWVEGMEKAMVAACQLGKPVVLDPVGAGATTFRNDTLLRLLAAGTPSIIRGNASEIMALAGQQGQTRGVDSTQFSTEGLESAQMLCRQLGCVVSISGETDVVVGPESVAYISNGNPIMTRITGMGCTASALAGAFAAIAPNAFEAAVAAAAVMGVCGELAYEGAHLPGSFQMSFLDKLSSLSPAELDERVQITIENNG